MQLRGALRGCTLPTQLSNLKKTLEGLGPQLPPQQTVTALIDELVAEGSVHGQLKGGGSTWVPAVHSRRQKEGVAAFYSQNGCIGCAYNPCCH